MKKQTRVILIAVFALVAAGCVGFLVWNNINAKKANDSYDKAKKEAVKPVKQEEATAPAVSAAIPIDFAALQTTNPDVYAWIQIPDTHVDYPLVQNETNDSMYLNHTWEGDYAEQGAIFTQSYNTKTFTDFNTVIYGHRMGSNNPTMFYDTHKYMDADFLKTHQDITIYTPENKRVYRVFAAVVYDDRLIPTAFDFNTTEGRQAYLDSIYGATDLRSVIADNVQATANDRIITLSSCIEGEADHRWIVGAVLVSEE